MNCIDWFKKLPTVLHDKCAAIGNIYHLKRIMNDFIQSANRSDQDPWSNLRSSATDMEAGRGLPCEVDAVMVKEAAL